VVQRQQDGRVLQRVRKGAHAGERSGSASPSTRHAAGLRVDCSTFVDTRYNCYAETAVNRRHQTMSRAYCGCQACCCCWGRTLGTRYPPISMSLAATRNSPATTGSSRSDSLRGTAENTPGG
jgi:hypothetical protein